MIKTGNCLSLSFDNEIICMFILYLINFYSHRSKQTHEHIAI